MTRKDRVQERCVRNKCFASRGGQTRLPRIVRPITGLSGSIRFIPGQGWNGAGALTR